MDNKPFIVAIGVIMAVGIVFILAAGPAGQVRPAPGNVWTLTYSMPVSNRMVIRASSPGSRVGPPPGGEWRLTFSIPASNCPAAFNTENTPQSR